MADYILYTHHDSEITSLEQFVENLGLSIVKGMTVQEVRDYTDDQGRSNNQRMYDAYNRYEKEEYQSEYQSGQLDFLKINTILALPKDKLFKETLAITGKNQIAEQKTFEAFYGEQLIKLLQDEGYKRSYRPPDVDFDTFNIEYPNITVWIWSRSLSSESSGELPGQIIDISPFVQDCRTSVDKNGGNFTLNVVPARAVFGEKDYWEIDFESLSQYFTDINGSSFVSHQSIRQKDVNDKWRRTTQFLHQCTNCNDVVFIRFETLEMEQQARRQKGSFTKSNTELPSNEGDLRIYDMIGLVDSSDISFQSQGNDLTITINGKDLSKLLIDDGSYFYPLQFAQNVFVNPDENDKLIKRLATDGQFILQSSLAYRSIRYTLQYIINHLASIGITPDELWEPYGDKRTQVYRLDNDEQQNPNQPSSPKQTQLKNLEKTIKAAIVSSKKQFAADALENTLSIINATDVDQAYKDQVIANATWLQGNFETQDVDVQTAFDLLQEWMGIIDQGGTAIELAGTLLSLTNDPFLVFRNQEVNNSQRFGNALTPSAIRLEGVDLTATDASLTPEQSAFVRQQKVIEEAQQFVSQATNDPNSLPTSTQTLSVVLVFNELGQRAWEYYKLKRSTQSTVNERFANGIWQIVKLLIDENVSDRRMSDPSISQPDGSLMEQFRKICQEPFVEFYTDTYEDLFYFIVRQPPFTQKAINSFLIGAPTTEINSVSAYNQLPILQYVTDVTITITEADVFSERFTFSDSEVYSFYEIKPQGLFAGKGSEVSLAYVPIIYFPQYADIWGTRRLSVVSNYLPFNGLVGTTTSENSNYLAEQAATDLKFLIDTNCYLPFVRQGSITINGDRRIKRGTFIRYEPTGEIFYVDSVTHFFGHDNARVDRTTTLQLSRGMIEEYILGKEVDIDGESVLVSYFDIVDTQLIKDFIVSTLKGDTQTETKLGVQLKRNFGVNDKVFNFFLKRKQFSYK